MSAACELAGIGDCDFKCDICAPTGWREPHKGRFRAEDGFFLRYLPRFLQCPGLCLAAVRLNPEALGDVVDSMRTRNLCLEAVSLSGLVLRFVPEAVMDVEICLAAVENNPFALKYVPQDFLDKRVCLAAVRRAGEVLSFVPWGMRDREICLAAVMQNPNALMLVPEQDEDLCLAAIRRDSFAWFHVRGPGLDWAEELRESVCDDDVTSTICGENYEISVTACP